MPRPVLAAAGALAEGADWVCLPPGEGDGRLAARAGVHLMSGGVLWGPDGRELCRQEPVLAGAADVQLVEVDGWPCGLVVGPDAWSPEVARVLQLRGALVLWVSYDPGASPWRALAGPWQLVQQTQCFALEAAAPPGASRVLGPCELTAEGDGFLGAVARLDAGRLAACRAGYDLRGQLNPGFYRRQLGRAYEA